MLDLNGEDGKNLSFIAREFERINQRFIPPILFEKVKYYYSAGLSAEVIVRAMEKTAIRMAHWEYTEGILKNCLKEGIYTVGIWDTEIKIKENISELKNRQIRFLPEEKLFSLAFYITFEKEFREIRDKLNLFLSDPETYKQVMFPEWAETDYDLEKIRADIKKERASP